MESFFGYVFSAHDAALLIAASQMEEIAQVTSRLGTKERNQIRSGSTFVFSEEKAGMRRWTDGHRWTKSRVEGTLF
jgi:hypothetical protein